MDELAEAYYTKGLAMGEVRRPYIIDSACRVAIRRYACYTVYQRCMNDVAHISFNKVCRSACFDVKDSCGTFEDCVEAPASQCSGVYSSANRVEAYSISLTVFTILAVIAMLL
jgi:hypothetical protein